MFNRHNKIDVRLKYVLYLEIHLSGTNINLVSFVLIEDYKSPALRKSVSSAANIILITTLSVFKLYRLTQQFSRDHGPL